MTALKEDISILVYRMYVSIVDFFTKISNTYMEIRQQNANYEIAKMLQRSEYPNESIDRIHDALNRGHFEELDKK